MTDLNKEREEFESDLADHLIERDSNGFYLNDEIQNYWEKHLLKVQIKVLKAELEKAKAQAVPTWISVDDEWPPTDIMVLICWADAPDVTPEQDYMTIDEDLNSVWANYQNDPPSHWMHFHSVPNVSGAEQ
ncbi:DUF551 domain-containing protein [Acinetobacter baumannii]|uniref:DUF551 domain-containing protein n=1 Tax=Acinetobacter baumannii TaxID=470 RepID=UPI001CDC6470|nr:DUF551 domain-containing protein [Acinetobacter baumannii]MCA4179805.1 DUF551 domain-containing protein [Acinetobacter baumannii]